MWYHLLSFKIFHLVCIQFVALFVFQTVFDHFVEKNILFRPTCTYLQKFYDENPLPQYTEKVKWD